MRVMKLDEINQKLIYIDCLLYSLHLHILKFKQVLIIIVFRFFPKKLNNFF